MSADPSNAEVLRDLARVKVMFQLRAIAAFMGVHPDQAGIVHRCGECRRSTEAHHPDCVQVRP